MANIRQVVHTFLVAIATLPIDKGHRSMDPLLEPVLELELDMRRAFATRLDDPSLLDPYIGLIDVFSIPTNVCLTRPKSWRESLMRYSFYSLKANKFCSYPQSYLFSLDKKLKRPPCSPAIVDNIAVFRENWRIFTHGALSSMSDWSNVIAAGGAVLASLMPIVPRPSNMDLNDFYQSDAYHASDIDLFLWGLTPEEACAKVRDIVAAIKRAALFPILCVRKVNTISIHTTYPDRPIQIILRLYQSPAEVLAGFDIDSSCCAYNGDTVFVSPRALAALVRQCNTVDIKRRSPSYEIRLAKYSERGFEVYLPSLARGQVSYDYFHDPYLWKFPSGLARLFVLEFVRDHPYHYCFLRYPGRKLIGPKNKKKAAIAAMDNMQESNYEHLRIRIPYGPNWDAQSVEAVVKVIDVKMNSPFNPINRGRRLHRHAVFCSPMIDVCLNHCCMDCPAPIDTFEEEQIISEASMYFRGPVQFIQDNPGRQLIGSFNPIDADDWAIEAYTFGEASGTCNVSSWLWSPSASTTQEQGTT